MLIGLIVNNVFRRIATWTRSVAPHARALGPYVLVELILPGGSLIALAIWIYNHRDTLLARWHSRATA